MRDFRFFYRNKTASNNVHYCKPIPGKSMLVNAFMKLIHVLDNALLGFIGTSLPVRVDSLFFKM